MKKFLQFPFELKALNEGELTGYASVFNVVDLDQEVVLPGAFVQIKRNEEGKIPFLWQHSTRDPIGVADVQQDTKGLRFDAQLVLEDPQARIARAHVKAGSVRGVSIGFDTLKDEIRGGIRYLKEIILSEISLVTFAANPLARVDAIKAAAECLSIDEWFEVLRSHGISKRKARRMALADWPILRGAEPEHDEPEISPWLKALAGELKAQTSIFQRTPK